MPADTLADGRQGGRIENYTKFWKNDLKREGERETEQRLDNYTEVVNGTYNLPLCEF